MKIMRVSVVLVIGFIHGYGECDGGDFGADLYNLAVEDIGAVEDPGISEDFNPLHYKIGAKEGYVFEPLPVEWMKSQVPPRYQFAVKWGLGKMRLSYRFLYRDPQLAHVNKLYHVICRAGYEFSLWFDFESPDGVEKIGSSLFPVGSI